MRQIFTVRGVLSKRLPLGPAVFMQWRRNELESSGANAWFVKHHGYSNFIIYNSNRHFPKSSGGIAPLDQA